MQGCRGSAPSYSIFLHIRTLCSACIAVSVDFISVHEKNKHGATVGDIYKIYSCS